MALSSFVGPWPLFQFLNLYTIGGTPWTADQPLARPLPIHRTTQTQNNAHRHPYLEWDSKPTISALKRVKTVHALGCVATKIGRW
jgi:hypothetical protein